MFNDLKTYYYPYKMELAFSTNETNNISYSDLNFIRDAIEKMNKFNQIQVLRILKKNEDVTLNENKYGIHINLTDLNKEIVEQLNDYINYVNTQESALNSIEKQKESYRNTYFSKDIKDKNSILSNK
jgi:hypothetical protein